MNTTKSKLQQAALLIGVVFGAPMVGHAQSIEVPGYIDLKETGEIVNLPILNYVSGGFTWQDLANYVVPVGQLTGYDVTGAAIDPLDLIPLRTTKLEIINPATGAVVSTINASNPGGSGATGPTGPQGPAGATGATGPQGSAGATGATGPQGSAGATGATGPQGAAGTAGTTGPQGPAGATGATGPAGAAATVAVGTTTTGAAGTNASVTNIGSPSAAVFNFTVPRGATGATGPAGPTGPVGIATATNGLTLTGSNVKLGGALIESTTVGVGAFGLDFMVGAASGKVSINTPAGETGFMLYSKSGNRSDIYRTDDFLGIRAGTTTPVNPATQFCLTNSGYLGLGTTAPQAPLHVAFTGAGGGGAILNGDRRWFTSNSSNLTPLVDDNASIPASILAEGGIVTKSRLVAGSGVSASATVTFSDSRIKNVQGKSISSEDLTTLNKIEIVDYKMKDKVTFGNKTFKKVIAQQVEKVYPMAVSQMTRVIPDVMKKTKITGAKGDLFSISLKGTDLKAGDSVELFNTENRSETVQVVSADVDGIKVKLSIAKSGDEIFVYGREVKDFRAVDYEAISMLNVSATQELSKKIEKQSEKIASLEAENAELKALAAKVERMEALVAALEGKAEGNVTVSLTK